MGDNYRRHRAWLILLIGVVVMGCASSRGPLPEGNALGEPCSDNDQCSSGVCIFVEGGGVCTNYCIGSDCPTGWECYGVADVGEPGEISSICVPIDTMLCRGCASNAECSLAGDDLCVQGPNGKSFCARDCSVIDCPVGYRCDQFAEGGQLHSQCIPVTDSCDCGPAEMDETEPCVVQTFNGDCTGQRVCGGPTGWSDCQGVSETDVPDGSFLDENCDGIDGDLNRSILVGPGGLDEVGCGLSVEFTCRTIGFALAQASPARNNVLVRAGFYPEIITVVSGVNIYGGYNLDWVRNTHTEPAHQVEILGGLHSSGRFASVVAIDVAMPTMIADMIIHGPRAQGQIGSSGHSSYAVYIQDSEDLAFERVLIKAGNGSNGTAGSHGLNAPTVVRLSAMNGRIGGGSREFVTSCNNTSHGLGGNGGTNTCAEGSVNPNGGRGGNGGEMDTSCTLGVCSNCTATPGDQGSSAAYRFGNYGRPGSGGSGNDFCGPAGVGFGGRRLNGSRGSAAASGGGISAGVWLTNAGGSGEVGNHGGGGGGGGGSGGCDIGTDSYGAGGGGGGAGGCRARGGGGGGAGGGGSFGVWALNSSVTLSNCAIVRGNGGNGGAGGIGGRGQSGGLAGQGGPTTNDSAPGGNGGSGMHGGHGGGGSGGAGGPSAAIAHSNSTIQSDCELSGGAGGSGGLGGTSAPTAPLAERDGVAGLNGPNGQVFGELSL